jgi:hypothetical protein
MLKPCRPRRPIPSGPQAPPDGGKKPQGGGHLFDEAGRPQPACGPRPSSNAATPAMVPASHSAWQSPRCSADEPHPMRQRPSTAASSHRRGTIPACQRYQPRLGFECDRRLPTGARAIVERCHRAFNHGALDAALNGLMMQSERPTDRKKRRIFPIGQQYPRSFDPARRLRSRLRYRFQLCRILICERQFNRPPPRCHDLPPSLGTRDLYRSPRIKMNPPVMTTFMESIV